MHGKVWNKKVTMILDKPPSKPNPTANERFRVTLHDGKRLYSIEECLEYAEQESQNIWPVKAAEMLRILAAHIHEMDEQMDEFKSIPNPDWVDAKDDTVIITFKEKR